MNMHADENSDGVIVPEKRPNKEGMPSAEAVEGRTPPKGNGGETAAARTLRRDTASNGLLAVRRAARQSKSVRFTALLHHITIDLLKQSYLSLERDSASGIDGVTWQTYGENLEEKLKELHDKVHRGSYRARPARRTYIPKADGSKRPLSILCLEDKIVDGSGSNLRGGLPRALLRIPARTRPARCAGRAPCRHSQEASELGA
jgi:RNA-directed DNA polymerase